jgi:hypothetical protein
MKAVDSAVIGQQEYFLYDLSLKSKGGVEEDMKYA